MITLNYRDARPIYEQVRDRLRRLIVSGAIADGEKLPVRALASQLAINPSTIQRAYSELESEGLRRVCPGKGSFAVRRGARRTPTVPALAPLPPPPGTLRETLPRWPPSPRGTPRRTYPPPPARRPPASRAAGCGARSAGTSGGAGARAGGGGR